MSETILRPTPRWLHEAVFYQIYPQSFHDSNGDGIGDLPGIIAKLDYLRSLGVTALWLNPIFDSPFGDAGYDVRDFLKIAPRYGTEADLRRLFREAHRRGLRVVLDLVAGHTSVEHPWFRDSSAHAPGKHRDRYIWTDKVWNDQPGNFIKGHAPRDGNYLANFFWFQPALNYGYATPDPAQPWQQAVDAPGPLATRAELKRIMAHWLRLGCDGFRVDMANSLIKGQGKPQARALHALWNEFRDWFDREHPEAVLISEWSNPRQAIPSGFHIDFMIHFGEPAYSALLGPFAEPRGDAREPHVFCERAGGGDIRAFLDNYLAHHRATRRLGYISLPTGNHDFARVRRGRDEAETRVVFALLLGLPGVPFLFYGDEIGLRHREGLPSKEGSYHPRTGTRVPMAWTSGRNKGFSSAPARALYLPADPAPDAPDVASQERDPGSMLHFTRRLLALRRAHPALGNAAAFRPLYAERGRYPFVFERRAAGERIIVAGNPRATPADCPVALPRGAARFEPLLTQGEVSLGRHAGRGRCRLGGVAFGIWRVAA